MKHFRKNGGFTLVELMVSILIGTIITGAAVTVLLLGLRMNKAAADTASRQNTTRTVLTVLEKLASDGKITDIKTSLNSWEVIEKAGNNVENVLLSYDADKQAIYTGKAPTTPGQKGSPILEDVYASHVSLEGQLLVISVQTEDGSYTSSVYCRTIELKHNVDNDEENVDAVNPGENIGDSVTTKVARTAFLNKLLSQKDRTVLGTITHNPGLILTNEDENGNVLNDKDGNVVYVSTGKYYTEWYIGNYATNPGWNKDTPWCAAYISWCLNQVGDTYVIAPTGRPAPDGEGSRWYANVDEFMAYMMSIENGYEKSEALGGTYAPQPGDLVFFDWIIDSEENPQHMGVVLSVAGGYIYTIEGNTAGRVALRKYPVNDGRILGYGVLNWN